MIINYILKANFCSDIIYVSLIWMVKFMRLVGKRISVISWCDEEGNVTPLRFKIKENDEEYVYKIDKVVTVKREKLAANPMLVFLCQSRINNIEKLFELKYDLGKCIWILYKM